MAEQLMAESNRHRFNWEMVTALSSALLALLGLAGALFVVVQIKDARAFAKIQNLNELSTQFDGDRWVAVRKSLALQRLDPKREKILPLNSEDAPEEMNQLLNFFQHIGLLASKGYLDKGDVWSEFGDSMFTIYTDAKPFVDKQQQDDPAVYGDLTDLMEDLRKIDLEDDDGKGCNPSTDEIRQYYEGEIEMQPGMPSPRKRPRKAH